MEKIYIIEPDNIEDVVFVLNDVEEVGQITGIQGKKWHTIYSSAFETKEEI